MSAEEKLPTWKRVPLARRLLLHQKSRFILFIVSVGFAVLVMFMQLGFLASVTDSHHILLPRLRGDLVILAKERETIARVGRTFDRARLTQAAQWPEVASVVPFYEDYVSIKNPETERLRYVNTLAFPMDTGAVEIDGLAELESALRRGRAFLWDERSRPVFGKLEPGSLIELGGQPFRLMGNVRLGPNIARDGYAIMSEGSYFSLGGRADRLSMGLIRLAPGADPAVVRDQLVRALPGDVVVHVVADLIAHEDSWVVKKTPAGVMFGSGLILGFVIGTVICYQILFNEVLHHLPQYATLKALGFTDGYLVRTVLHESVLLACFGFVLGGTAAGALYLFLGQASGMVMAISWDRPLLVFLLSLCMCCGAGLLALRRALQADPAEVF